MIYYSHSRKDDLGKTLGSKELKIHIAGVQEKAFFHLTKNLDLRYSEDELKELLKLLAVFHDFGKYTSYFQDYLLRRPNVNVELKRHAQVGGVVAYNFLKKKDGQKALLALYLISLHHNNLINVVDVGRKFDRQLRDIIEQQLDDLKEKLPTIEQELSLQNIERYLHYINDRDLRKGYKIWSINNTTIQDYFIINYLFSLQIEADKLDASDTHVYELKDINSECVDIRFGRPYLSKKELSYLTNNELRNHCRSVVVSHLDSDKILENYLFTLTAPTGIGKTMTALDFALKLKKKLKEEKKIEARIIYALPFINIIEQALYEYQETLKTEKVKILAHYQYADVFGEKKQEENEVSEGHSYNQKLMMLDTWQADIIITSFVQFFETLIGNRNKLLKKFNHFANAIIILDEVQTLRLEYLPLLGSVLFYLSKFLKSRIVLMSATRPKIFELAQQEIVKSPILYKELLVNHEEVFALFNRTSIHPILDRLQTDGTERTDEFIEKIFSKKWHPGLSALIVVNTVNLSIKLYESLQLFINSNNYKNTLYYLSTNIIPVDRLVQIEQIQDELRKGHNPILVATQVVEAGVDLDFDIGFRDIGPIDSIIQVAGRINRNNHPDKAESPLFIVDFNEKATINVYGTLTYIQAKRSLCQQKIFKEREYLKLVNSYFKDISDKRSFSRSRYLFQSMESLRYDYDNINNCPVSSFKIIEESNQYRSVFIEINDKARSLAEKYLEKITALITAEEFNQKYKLDFQQHIITVPHYLCNDLDFINEYEDNILIVPLEKIELFYNQNTGFIRKKPDTNVSYTF